MTMVLEVPGGVRAMVRMGCWWGLHLGVASLRHGVLLVKTLSSSLDELWGITSVVPSLEASSLEAHLSFGIAGDDGS